MFLDKVTIKLKAGDGGDGKVSFFRSKLNMNGGPDGGDGGKGGDIVFVANENINTLYNFKFKKKFVAENGNGGEQNFRTGKNGKDITIEVPVGTVIKNAENGNVLVDLCKHGKTCKLLTGGSGGKGNTFYKSSTRQAPMFSQTGEKTKEYMVTLELKTIADVGLVGFPNVGKSTLLSVISNAKPKIANYHFTTLVPNLGIVARNGQSFVVADIPGLIEGASDGLGLGHDFLRHVERVRLIVHVVDISQQDGRDAFDDYCKINTELEKYSQKLASLPQIVVLSKCDVLEDNSRIDSFKKKLPNDVIVIPISSITHNNVELLIAKMQELLSKLPKAQEIESQQERLDVRDVHSIVIDKIDEATYEISGGYIDNLVRKIVLDDEISFAYFQKRIKDDGVWDMLKSKGAKDGDTIRIKDTEFDMID